jgi:hypothetical protein
MARALFAKKNPTEIREMFKSEIELVLAELKPYNAEDPNARCKKFLLGAKEAAQKAAEQFTKPKDDYEED